MIHNSFLVFLCCLTRFCKLGLDLILKSSGCEICLALCVRAEGDDLICNVKCRHGGCVLQKAPFPSAAHSSCSETFGSSCAAKVMLRFSGQIEVCLIVLLIGLSVMCCASVGLDSSPRINTALHARREKNKIFLWESFLDMFVGLCNREWFCKHVTF